MHNATTSQQILSPYKLPKCLYTWQVCVLKKKVNWFYLQLTKANRIQFDSGFGYIPDSLNLHRIPTDPGVLTKWVGRNKENDNPAMAAKWVRTKQRKWKSSYVINVMERPNLNFKKKIKLKSK